MPVADFDISTYAGHGLPPYKRLPQFVAAFKSFLSGLSWGKNIFDGYRNGDNQPYYDPATTYATGDKAKFNFATYESLIDSNTGNQPDTNLTGDSPAWIKRNANFIGATNRAKYDGKYLSLTAYLNEQFDTTFRQPPYPAPYDFGISGGIWSDIFITNDPISYGSFIIGSDLASAGVARASFVYSGFSSGWIYGTEVFTSASSYRYVINMPVAVFNGLGANDAIRESVVRKFVDDYNTSGTTYRIVTY